MSGARKPNAGGRDSRDKRDNRDSRDKRDNRDKAASAVAEVPEVAGVPLAAVPRLRFKGFEGEWKKKHFSDEVERVSVAEESSSLPWIEYEDIVSGAGTLNKNVFEKSNHKKGLGFKSGDVLFGKLRPYLLNIFRPQFAGIAVGDFWILRHQNSGFLYHFLFTQLFQDIANKSAGSKMPRSDWSVVSQAEFCFPAPSEQSRIADFFSRLDAAIAGAKARVRKLREVKKAMLVKMFPQEEGECSHGGTCTEEQSSEGRLPKATAKPNARTCETRRRRVPEIRFKGFDGEWEKKELGSLVQRITRKNLALESELPLTISAEYGLVDQTTFFNSRVAAKNVSNYYLVKRGEFAYNKSSSDGYPFGAIKRLDRYSMGVLSTLYIVFSLNSEEIDSDYLVHFYDTKLWHRDVSLCAAEGARNHGLLNISATDFFKTHVLLPRDLAEQRKIGAFFSNLDRLIAAAEKRVGKLREVKSALLEGMFARGAETTGTNGTGLAAGAGRVSEVAVVSEVPFQAKEERPVP